MDIASEVDKINRLTTFFWEELCFRYLITFHPFYQDCEEVATDILKQLKNIMKHLIRDFEKLTSFEDVLRVWRRGRRILSNHLGNHFNTLNGTVRIN